MKSLVRLLIGCAALAVSVGAFAQDRGYWDHERLMREYRAAFYDRLQVDLDRAERAHYLSGEDYRRFDRAHREVAEFSAKWSRGVFDGRDLDGAIASVQRVVDIRVLHREDRDALLDDLGRMRALPSAYRKPPLLRKSFLSIGFQRLASGMIADRRMADLFYGVDHQLRLLDLYPVAALLGDDMLAVRGKRRDCAVFGQSVGRRVGR